MVDMPLCFEHIGLLSKKDQKALLLAGSRCNAEAFGNKSISNKEFRGAFNRRNALLSKLGVAISLAMDRREIPIPYIAPEDVAVGYGAGDM